MSDNKNNPVNEEVEELSEEKLNEQRLIRRQKLQDLRDAGRDPYIIETWDQDAYSADIKADFEAMDGKEVTVAGRMMA